MYTYICAHTYTYVYIHIYISLPSIAKVYICFTDNTYHACYLDVTTKSLLKCFYISAIS